MIVSWIILYGWKSSMKITWSFFCSYTRATSKIWSSSGLHQEKSVPTHPGGTHIDMVLCACLLGCFFADFGIAIGGVITDEGIHIYIIVGFFIPVSSLKGFGHSIHSERRRIYLGRSIQALQNDTIIISWYAVSGSSSQQCGSIPLNF